MKSNRVRVAVGILLLAVVAWFIYPFLQAGAAFQSGILAHSRRRLRWYHSPHVSQETRDRSKTLQ